MSKNLVIVESPSKAKTISKMLGADYTVMASMGHVRDLPARSLGVDIENHFQPKYEETVERQKNLSGLKKAAKTASNIYLASDPDREGEAIAWHLKEILRKQNAKASFQRATFHEITRNAIARAFRNTGDINMNLVNSQQARRILDRIVGFQISRLLWGRVERGISAGRVQSVALRLVCEREREIQAFAPQEYWNFTAKFLTGGRASAEDSVFYAKLAKINGGKFLIPSAAEAEHIQRCVQTVPEWTVGNVDVQPRKKYAAPPFITSTMQQTAGSSLGFSANQTMRVAQSLYEGVDVGNGPLGLITYMRTDSVAVAVEAQTACRSFIASEYGPEYVPQKPNIYRSKSSSQGAHEAIRPTDVTLTPSRIKSYLDAQQFTLYSLIWHRFVASQMQPAEQERTTADIEGVSSDDGRTYQFRSVATVTRFPGFLRVYDFRDEGAGSSDEDDEDNRNAAILAKLKKGDPCSLKDLLKEQKFTEPPARYSEATLIKELEANGVGRPSTYASIVNTIQERKYVDKEKGKLIPTDLGFRVNDYLVNALPALFQVGFTADMENKLDDVESGKVQWTDMLGAFYTPYQEWLNAAKSADAPASGKSAALLRLLSEIPQWETAEPVPGKRVFNEKKFMDSILKKGVDAPVSPKQWNVLLSLSVKYADRLPGLRETARENGFADELADVEKKEKEQAVAREERELRRQEAEASAPEQENIGKVFDAMANVPWAAPVKRGRRTYDDRQFVESLKEQKDSGRLLSEKQLQALGKVMLKYADKIPDCAALMTEFGLSAGPAAVADAASDGPEMTEAKEKTDSLFAFFENLKEWNAPVSRRGRVYDDKKFFQSLKQQKDSGKILSVKQLSALEKLMGKYMDKGSSSGNDGETDGTSAEHETAESVPSNQEAERLLNVLAGVKNWEEPVKRGRRTYDDKEFYRSVAGQAAGGRALSTRQIDALKKLAEKYKVI